MVAEEEEDPNILDGVPLKADYTKEMVSDNLEQPHSWTNVSLDHRIQVELLRSECQDLLWELSHVSSLPSRKDEG
jgi:hypothetical protein